MNAVAQPIEVQPGVVPMTLIVNADEASRAALLPALERAFKIRPSFSIYSRPFTGPHPRMRPHGGTSGNEPMFGLVLIDVSTWVQHIPVENVLGEALPEWIRSDLVGHLKQTLVIFVTPMKALQAVANILAASKLPAGTPVMALEDDTRMSEWLVRFWTRWQAGPPSTDPAETAAQSRIRDVLDWLTRGSSN